MPGMTFERNQFHLQNNLFPQEAKRPTVPLQRCYIICNSHLDEIFPGLLLANYWYNIQDSPSSADKCNCYQLNVYILFVLEMTSDNILQLITVKTKSSILIMLEMNKTYL